MFPSTRKDTHKNDPNIEATMPGLLLFIIYYLFIDFYLRRQDARTPICKHKKLKIKMANKEQKRTIFYGLMTKRNFFLASDLIIIDLEIMSVQLCVPEGLSYGCFGCPNSDVSLWNLF